MLVTNSEMLLFVWGSAMTVLWQRSVFDAKEFKRFTVYRLQEVASGRAKVIDTGESIEIKPIKE
jgi:hypothetical protein